MKVASCISVGSATRNFLQKRRNFVRNYKATNRAQNPLSVIIKRNHIRNHNATTQKNYATFTI